MGTPLHVARSWSSGLGLGVVVGALVGLGGCQDTARERSPRGTPAPRARGTQRPVTVVPRTAAPPRKASLPVRYLRHRGQIVRIVKRPGLKPQREILGSGLLAPTEADGHSYAAALRTAELCTDPGGTLDCQGQGPCHKRKHPDGHDCVSGARWAVYSPTGKIIHREKAINYLPAVGSVLSRYVVWTVLFSQAEGDYRSVIFDSHSKRKFTTGAGTPPKIGTSMVRYRLTYNDFPPSERPKAMLRSHRCFHVRTWKEHVVGKPKRCGWKKRTTPRPSAGATR